MDTMQDESAQFMDSLVSVEWLNEHLGDPDLVVLDCSVMLEQDESGGIRSISGRAAYEAGHIPTAGFADLTGELSDADSPIRYAVPAPEQFAAAMEKLGVGDDTRVVLYDSSGSMWAARVWWMLRWIGFDRAALLDGGLNAWTSAGHALSTDVTVRDPGSLTVNLRPQLIADRDEVFAAIDNADVELIDALPEAHYRGEMAMYERPGHIPTASNVPVFSLLDENGQFRQEDELRGLFESNPDDRTITYCGGGIAASADAFILTRLGYEDVAVYTASLQEWAADPANPLETASGVEEAER
ncbi:MAG: sulfurtransferase [Woeseiaceae bacterium]|nr:sulfurtransferase [Woeseiaceae bacterium]